MHSFHHTASSFALEKEVERKKGKQERGQRESIALCAFERKTPTPFKFFQSYIPDNSHSIVYRSTGGRTGAGSVCGDGDSSRG